MLWLLRQILSKVAELYEQGRAMQSKMISAIQELALGCSRIEARLAALETIVAEQGKQLSVIAGLLSPPEAIRIVFVANVDGVEVEYKEGDTMILKAGQKQKVKIKAVDAFGNPTTLDPTSPIAWGTSNPEVATLAADSSDTTGTVGVITSVGKIGTAQGTARGDAKMGPEVKELIGLLDIEVVAGEAVTVTLEPVGTPIDPQ